MATQLILRLMLRFVLGYLNVWLVIISTFKYMITVVALVASVVSDWMDVLEPLPHFHFYNFLRGLASVCCAATLCGASLVLGVPRAVVVCLAGTLVLALMMKHWCGRGTLFS